MGDPFRRIQHKVSHPHGHDKTALFENDILR